MIDKIMDLVTGSITWWRGLLEPLCTPAAVFSIFAFSAVVTLFFILRYEYKRWGQMWGGEGIFEFMVAGFTGAVITSSFYLLPMVAWVTLAALIALALLTCLTKLVKISVGEY